MSSLSVYDDLRVHSELRLVQSIRRKLKKAKLVLRPTDKSGVFHIGSMDDYERKAVEYREKTNAYIELSENPLQDIINKVTRLLNDLQLKKQILVKKHYDKMMPDRQKVELSHMYYVPKAHKKYTPLRPIINTIKAPTTSISRFLDKLIRPLFDKHARSTTIVDGTDLIRQLHQYVENDRLQPSTLFCTFDITDLYTMLPQEESLHVLCEFLIEHGYRKIQGIPIDAIRKLARLVLTENVFVDGKKIYRQILGGAMGSPFTLTLANIFMWKWQKEFALQQLNVNEIYGRYIDDVFFTSNQPIAAIEKLLKDADSYHPNIRLTAVIGKSVTFLDVRIENNNGILSTSVYYKESAEPYLIPFKSDHPRHIFGNIIRGALTRAARYSTTLKAFDDERRNVKLTLLYNGYPSQFIDTHFKKFFINYDIAMPTILPLILDEKEFYQMSNNKFSSNQSFSSSSYDNEYIYHITDDLKIKINDIIRSSDYRLFFDDNLSFDQLMFLLDHRYSIESSVLDFIIDQIHQLIKDENIREILFNNINRFAGHLHLVNSDTDVSPRPTFFLGDNDDDDYYYDDDDDDEQTLTDDDSSDADSIFDDSYDDLENDLLDRLDFEHFLAVYHYSPPSDDEYEF
ncbi:unnamed protein product [Rotaria sp. Silwood1]|nr:unnamed protein product [Rotaria sp. Silwood1]